MFATAILYTQSTKYITQKHTYQYLGMLALSNLSKTFLFHVEVDESHKKMNNF